MKLHFLQQIILSVFLLFFNSNIGYSQKDNTDFYLQLRTVTAQKINQLRIDQKIMPLKFDPILEKAAVFHTIYMQKKNILSHEEPQKIYKTPQLRYQALGGNNMEMIGENIQYISLKKSELTRPNINQLADQLALNWKNSAPHYANILNKSYTHGDFGFVYDSISERLYATEVFGKKVESIYENGAKNNYGLENADSTCKTAYNGYANSILNIGNDIEIKGQDVYLYYSNIDHWKKLFPGPKDGIAVDLITRDQFPCEKENLFTPSSVFKGILLPPVYNPELLLNNEALNKNHIISKVGTLPDSLLIKRLSPSVLIIKDGKVCQYVIPAYVPRSTYNYLPIEPHYHLPAPTKYLDSGYISYQEVNYDFDVNKTTPTAYPKITDLHRKPSHVDIIAYSSIEGDTAHNNFLHNERAKTIQQHIIRTTGALKNVFSLQTGENWNYFKFQLLYYNEPQLALLPHDSIKKIIFNSNASTIPWYEALSRQRVSKARIFYSGKYNSKSRFNEMVTGNLMTAIITKNANLADQAMYDILRKKIKLDPELLFEESTIDFIFKNPKLITNYSALLASYYLYNIENTTRFIYDCTKLKFLLTPEAKFNLLNLYSLLGEHFLGNWDVSSARLVKLIPPEKVRKWEFDTLAPELQLNLQLTYIEYFGQYNNSAEINNSFKYIVNYFSKQKLKIPELVQLALFCNRWSMYDQAINLLLPEFRNQKLNEEGMFVLAQTMNFYYWNKQNEELLNVIKAAQKVNPARWCNWINNDFQLLYSAEIKQIYCTKCKNH